MANFSSSDILTVRSRKVGGGLGIDSGTCEGTFLNFWQNSLTAFGTLAYPRHHKRGFAMRNFRQSQQPYCFDRSHASIRGRSFSTIPESRTELLRCRYKLVRMYPASSLRFPQLRVHVLGCPLFHPERLSIGSLSLLIVTGLFHFSSSNQL